MAAVDVYIRRMPASLKNLGFTQSAASATLIAAVAGKVVRIWGCSIGGTSNPVVTISDTGGNILWGPAPLSSTGNPFIIYTPTGEYRRGSAYPFLETAIGTGLVFAISGGGTIGGKIDYEQVTPITTDPAG